jgi:6-phosphogluconolactonase (cycloisomerase 2 family)
MYLPTLLIAITATAVQVALATNLFVSSYDGTVSTLSLSGSGWDHELKLMSQSRDCGSSPSWMVYNKPDSILYCLDENTAAKTAGAVFTSYFVDNSTDSLKVAASNMLSTTASVSGVLFGDNKYMAVAGYFGQLSALNVNKATFSQTQKLDFVGKTELAPGQTSPHPHQTILDPTGKFIVVPDLGGDLLRVFSWSAETANNAVLKEQTSFKVATGSGPRHATFWKDDSTYDANDNTYLFVLAELANTITTYKVSYLHEDGLNFTEVNTQNTFGGAAVPIGAAAAEIQVSPDNLFLVVSNRNDLTYEISQYGSADKNASEKSDSLATYAIGPGGNLVFRGIYPAGGSNPRQFTINKAGDMIAVGLQKSCRVVVLCRDVVTGQIGRPLAHIPLGDCTTSPLGPTMIVWDE